jgi:hypothetical protein
MGNIKQTSKPTPLAQAQVGMRVAARQFLVEATHAKHWFRGLPRICLSLVL